MDVSIEKKVNSTVVVESCRGYAAELVQAAISNAFHNLGGIEQFVRPGQTILIKPNLLSPRLPEKAVTTHPVVVRTVIELCQQAGAGRIWFGDSCAGNHTDERLWEKTGMAEVAAATGAELRSFSTEIASRPCGKRRVPVPAWLDDVDAIISLPKLKTHLLTTLTAALKNMYGMVAGEAKSLYHGSHPSPQQMSEFLVEIYAAFPPVLTIIDAVEAMEGEGPANGVPVKTELILAGSDSVALDTICAGLLGLKAADIPMLKCAAQRLLGTADLSRIKLNGSGVERLGTIRLRRSKGRILHYLPDSFYRLASRLLSYRPVITPQTCVRCGICQKVCSQHAIYSEEDGSLKVDSSRCILCMCCLEACPHEALTVRSPLYSLRRRRNRRRK